MRRVVKIAAIFGNCLYFPFYILGQTLKILSVKDRTFSLVSLLRVYIEYFLKSKILFVFFRTPMLWIKGFKVYGGSYNSLLFLFEEIFLFEEYKFSFPIDGHPTFLDCGANIGMATLYFFTIFPEGKASLFEPNPETYSILEKNISANNLNNASPFQLGLGEEEGEMEFFHNSFKGSFKSSIFSNRGGELSHTVRFGKLSNYVDSDDFVICKIDVEGSELKVLSELLRSKKFNPIQLMLIEAHNNLENNLEIVGPALQTVKEMGFSYKIRSNFSYNERFHDLFIYAYRDQNDESNLA